MSFSASPISQAQRRALIAQLNEDVKQQRFTWGCLFPNSDQRALVDDVRHLRNPELQKHAQEGRTHTHVRGIHVPADFQRLYGSQKWAKYAAEQEPVSTETQLHSQDKVQEGRAVFNCEEYVLHTLCEQGFISADILRSMSDEMAALGPAHSSFHFPQ